MTAISSISNSLGNEWRNGTRIHAQTTCGLVNTKSNQRSRLSPKSRVQTTFKYLKCCLLLPNTLQPRNVITSAYNWYKSEMGFGLLFKPLVRLFIISQRNITLVSWIPDNISRSIKWVRIKNRAKDHNYHKSEVCHEVQSSS